MKIKKFFAAVVVMALGVYAVHTAWTNPQAKELLGRFSESRLLAAIGVSTGAEAETVALPEGTDGETGPGRPEGSLPPFPSEVEIPETEKPESSEAQIVLPTTIEGGMVITNNTSFELDLGAMVSAGTSVKLAAEGPQILIIHTHGSEAYTPDGTDSYENTDNFRTDDPKYSVIRVGDELAACFESYGLSVIHDKKIYDYPSYTGSYGRSEQAVKEYLAQYPTISVVLDVHRDAIGDGDVVYKTVAEAGGKPCSQVMLLVGTGENGLEHPNWQENLRFALYLQSAVVKKYPSLCRPIALKKERYNQHLSTGYLILEVGSSGNTLEEALNAVRLLADAAAPALKELS